MSLQDTPAAERVHIAFFGVRNVGKSSLVNAVTGQSLSIVSDVAGTTTDPVQKTMELLPLGPVVIIDTPGIDDVGALGEERVRRTKKVLNKTDIAVLVIDATRGLTEADREMLALFHERDIPFLVAANKTDLIANGTEPPNSDPLALDAHAAVLSSVPSGQSLRTGGALCRDLGVLSRSATISVSAATGRGIHELKEALGALAKSYGEERPLVRDLVEAGDLVILVIPIDKSAPKGRLILPQQMVIRDLLDAGAMPLLVRDTEYASAISRTFCEGRDDGTLNGASTASASYPHTSGVGAPPVLSDWSAGTELSTAASATKRERPDVADMKHSPPIHRLRLVITDSQVFDKIASQTPASVPLTSFSMLMARYKGGLEEAVRGAHALDDLQDGDTILISEGCTHHRQCEDIGTVKLPRWIREYTGKDLQFDFTSGGDFPEDLSGCSLIIHCGGCMLNEREMRSRRRHAEDEGVPMTNYGVLIAKMNGVLDRCVATLI